MTVRKLRVLHPIAWSQRPLETNHVVSNVTIKKENKNGDVRSPPWFHMMELRRDDGRHFAGKYTHHLKTKTGYAIQLQRVDMASRKLPTTTCCRSGPSWRGVSRRSAGSPRAASLPCRRSA